LAMNAGPVIKINANQRYATEAETEAHFELCCRAAGVPFQKWASRADLACGSTIGPITAGRLGIRTVDVGNPQLGMHSARETCGSEDSAFLISALEVFHGGL
jgi:aspartyl aminopeptidase